MLSASLSQRRDRRAISAHEEKFSPSILSHELRCLLAMGEDWLLYVPLPLLSTFKSKMVSPPYDYVQVWMTATPLLLPPVTDSSSSGRQRRRNDCFMGVISRS